MTFRTTLQDLEVAVWTDDKGNIVRVFLLGGAGSRTDILEHLKTTDPKHIKDLEEEASQHLQEEAQDPPNSYDSRM